MIWTAELSGMLLEQSKWGRFTHHVLSPKRPHAQHHVDSFQDEGHFERDPMKVIIIV